MTREQVKAYLYHPDVWRALGTNGKQQDKPFLHWLRQEPCAKCGSINIPGHRENAPHHIRMVSQGSGTAIKPAFCALPLCPIHHEYVHREGYRIIGDKDQWEVWRWYYVAKWTAMRLLEVFDCTDWGSIPLETFNQWLKKEGIDAQESSANFVRPGVLGGNGRAA